MDDSNKAVAIKQNRVQNGKSLLLIVAAVSCLCSVLVLSGVGSWFRGRHDDDTVLSGSLLSINYEYVGTDISVSWPERCETLEETMENPFRKSDDAAEALEQCNRFLAARTMGLIASLLTFVAFVGTVYTRKRAVKHARAIQLSLCFSYAASSVLMIVATVLAFKVFSMSEYGALTLVNEHFDLLHSGAASYTASISAAGSILAAIIHFIIPIDSPVNNEAMMVATDHDASSSYAQQV